MNITLINADSIFWNADKSIRTVSFDNIFKQIENICVPDQIYFIAGLEGVDPFNESINEILRKHEDKTIIPVSSITQIGNRHNPEFVLADLLYRGVLSQPAARTNRFTIVSADASSVRSANFLAQKGLIDPVDYILSDCLDIPAISQKVNVRGTISLKPENKNIVDRTSIKVIMDIIKGDSRRETPFLNTTAVLLRKCKAQNGIDSVLVRPLILSLIHNGYLARQKFISNDGVQRTAIVMGTKSADELLQKH